MIEASKHGKPPCARLTVVWIVIGAVFRGCVHAPSTQNQQKNVFGAPVGKRGCRRRARSHDTRAGNSKGACVQAGKKQAHLVRRTGVRGTIYTVREFLSKRRCQSGERKGAQSSVHDHKVA